MVVVTRRGGATAPGLGAWMLLNTLRCTGWPPDEELSTPNTKTEEPCCRYVQFIVHKLDLNKIDFFKKDLYLE